MRYLDGASRLDILDVATVGEIQCRIDLCPLWRIFVILAGLLGMFLIGIGLVAKSERLLQQPIVMLDRSEWFRTDAEALQRIANWRQHEVWSPCCACLCQYSVGKHYLFKTDRISSLKQRAFGIWVSGQPPLYHVNLTSMLNENTIIGSAARNMGQSERYPASHGNPGQVVFEK